MPEGGVSDAIQDLEPGQEPTNEKLFKKYFKWSSIFDSLSNIILHT